MQVDRRIAKGQVVPLLFQQAAVAANQTDEQLPVVEVGTSPSLVLGHIVPFAGSIIGISAILDSAGSAGALAVGATIGGTEHADTLLSFTTEANLSRVVPRSKAKFAAGAEIGAEITTDASWNGTASDLAVIVWVLIELEGI